MDIREALGHIAQRRDLGTDQMIGVMRQIMSGGADNAQIGAFLMGMRLKGETIDEITGGVMVMRELVTAVDVTGEYLLDIVGTGGDGASLFNISTATTFVVAAAGGRVAKHGNRSVSSKSGAADLLEAAGVNLGITPGQVAQCVDELGVGFMFAPAHHSAMKYAAGPRKELAMRTIFNILGPMTNPAGVRRMLIGVFDDSLCRPMAEVLGRLGAEHAMVVHSEDGLDEISTAAHTRVAEYKGGQMHEFHIDPHDFGLNVPDLSGLEVEDADGSLALICSALNGVSDERSKKAAGIVALNAGAAIHVAGLCGSIEEGVTRAQAVIADGSACAALQELATLTSSFID